MNLINKNPFPFLNTEDQIKETEGKTLLIYKFLKTLKVILLAALFFNFSSIPEATDEWTLIQTVNNVKFYYQSGQCNGHTLLFLKIVNDNTTEVHGHWRLNIDQGTGKMQFMGVLMDMKAGVTKTGSCEDPGPELMIPLELQGSPQLSIEANFTVQ